VERRRLDIGDGRMTAQAWAEATPAGAPVRWRALEVAAFESQPKVLRALDPKGKYAHGRNRGGGWRKTGLALLGFFAVIVFYFPSIAGFTTLIGDRFNRSHPDPNVTVPVAGSIFAFALAMLVVTFVSWLRSGRPKDVGGEVQSSAAAVLGWLSAYVAGTRGSAANTAGWQLWTGVIALCAAFGTVYLVLLLIAHRAASARELKAKLRGETAASGAQAVAGSGAAVEPLKQVRLAVERLSPDDQARVRGDIDGAIDTLAARGVISADEAQWARGAELGKLALRMSQPRPRRAPDGSSSGGPNSTGSSSARPADG
jgi:hypothetical protein